MRPVVKLLTDIGPLALFFIAYVREGLIVATAVFVVATVVSLAVAYTLTRKLPLTVLISAAVILVFGGLTILLADETFIKMKPTVVSGLFAVILLGGWVLGRPVLRYLFGTALALTDRGWNMLALYWSVFFIVVAVLNEIVWRTQSTDTWVFFKVFGILPLTLLFGAILIPLVKRYQI